MLGECVERVVGGAVEVLPNGGHINRTIKANHHEWRYYVNPNGDGFHCVFCPALRPFPTAHDKAARL